MDFSASSSVASNSQFPCFDQQPEQPRKSEKRKNKVPKGVPGQRRLMRRGRSSGPPVSKRSSVVVADRCRRPSASVLHQPATAPFAQRLPGDVSLCAEAGDITIDDAEFTRPTINYLQQFCKSFSAAKDLNNPEIVRSEFAERVRHNTFNVSVYSGSVALAGLLFMGVNALLNRLEEEIVRYSPARKDIRPHPVDLLLLWFLISVCIFLIVWMCRPAISMLSYIPTFNATAIVDTREKKVASDSGVNAAERLLKKYDRMESLLDRLNKLRSSEFLTRSVKRRVRDSSKLTNDVESGKVGGGAARNVTLKETGELHVLEREDVSFYFSSPKKNRKKLIKAIVETREWLDGAKKQVRLIRDHSASAVDKTMQS